MEKTTLLLLISCVLIVGTATELFSSAERVELCKGTSNHLSRPQNKVQHYEQLKLRYTNCTYVDGNLEITNIEDPTLDLSYLEDIREVSGYVLIGLNNVDTVPLKNLRVIRGATLYEGNAFFVVLNYNKQRQGVGLKELQLTSLKEIISGGVNITQNKELCYISTVDWSDIVPVGASVALNLEHQANIKCPETCHPSCSGHCWGSGPSNCQVITKNACAGQCDHRCNGPDLQNCCHQSCAAGCTGPSNRDCLACLNFDDDGACVSECPDPFIYDPNSFANVPNPNAKYAYGSKCVKECPEHLLVDQSSCVKSCPHGKIAKDGVCQKCEGPCPKTCIGFNNDELDTPYDQIDERNIHMFQNCTVIDGSLVITPSTFDGDPYYGVIGIRREELDVLKTVREVTGYVNIFHSGAQQLDLSFLENLEIIQGRDLYEGYALNIMGTTLRSLGMVSLRKISMGNVFIQHNSYLCYVTSAMFDDILENTNIQKANVKRNRNRTTCENEGAVCHEECTSTGCWGPRADECIECKNYKLGDQCVKECDLENEQYLVSEIDRECGLCHPECLGSCSGPGADNCTSCKHFQDGPFCKEECPVTKYGDENDLCQECHANCKLEGETIGCTGPENKVGDGGCKSCHQVLLDENDKLIRCLEADTECPDRHFKRMHLVGPYADTLVCQACHDECISCTDKGPYSCTECRHYKQGGICIPECVSNYYADENKICQKCNAECRGGCHGDNPTQCAECLNYQIPTIDEKQGINTTFCVSECPFDKPYVMDDNVCVSNCTGNTFANTKNICQGCHDECLDGCHDERRSSCFACKNFRTQSGECVKSCRTGQEIEQSGICKIKAEPIAQGPRADSTPIIVGCVVGVALILAIIIFIVWYFRRQRQLEDARNCYLDYPMEKFTEPLTPSGAAPNQAFLRIIKETELKKGGVLGSGAFGTVYKGLWLPEGDKVRIPVAIKVIREGISNKANQELLEEAYVMATVNHDHLVRLLCVCMSQKMMLITQLMPLGALLDYIREHKNKVSSQHLLNWCTQIAKGMVYLEEHRLVHRDLAARNVLVESPTKVKITDFGLAKFIEINEEEYKAEGGKMPIKWLALECITHRRFTHQSDVWSFGVTAWELMTFGGKPYEGVKARDVPELLEIGERLPQPQICTIDVYMIMLKCWMLDADSRPTFRELVEDFTKMARDPQRYLVIENDGKEPLPSPSRTEFYRSLLPDEGPDLLMDAEDYLQPVSTFSGSSGSDGLGSAGYPTTYAPMSSHSPPPRIPDTGMYGYNDRHVPGVNGAEGGEDIGSPKHPMQDKLNSPRKKEDSIRYSTDPLILKQAQKQRVYVPHQPEQEEYISPSPTTPIKKPSGPKYRNLNEYPPTNPEYFEPQEDFDEHDNGNPTYSQVVHRTAMDNPEYHHFSKDNETATHPLLGNSSPVEMFPNGGKKASDRLLQTPNHHTGNGVVPSVPSLNASLNSLPGSRQSLNKSMNNSFLSLSQAGSEEYLSDHEYINEVPLRKPPGLHIPGSTSTNTTV
ncbi:epidermal growth factor receptor-like isoform X4 [Ptychodera flava]|uniref:epidermal growth factor receptor-like isoform X4 n=1 Tax=Ptychodera flava TaxID=63121 RepID=UPI00396A0540